MRRINRLVQPAFWENYRKKNPNEKRDVLIQVLPLEYEGMSLETRRTSPNFCTLRLRSICTIAWKTKKNGIRRSSSKYCACAKFIIFPSFTADALIQNGR